MYFTPVVETAHAEATVTENVATEVLVEVVYSREDIIEKIKAAFPEAPETAVKVAICESNLVKDIQSHHVLNGVRERSFGIFQIHEPSWNHVAMNLGYTEYQTDIEQNIAIARYIYDNAGKSFRDWSCYSKGMI